MLRLEPYGSAVIVVVAAAAAAATTTTTTKIRTRLLRSPGCNTTSKYKVKKSLQKKTVSLPFDYKAMLNVL